MFKKRILKLLPVSLFLVFTFAVYMPSSLYLSNIDEFSVDFGEIVPVILILAAIMLLAIYSWCIDV